MNEAGALLPLSAAALGIACLASIPGGLAVLTQYRSRAPRDNFYQDEDGVSTPEAVAAFSNKASKSAIVALSAASLASLVAASILAAIEPTRAGPCLETWLITGSGAVVLSQTIFLTAHHSPVRTHDLALWDFLSSLATLPAALLQVSYADRSHVSFILRIVHVCATLALLVACLSVPRRPHVFYKGRQVDSEWTVSAISRYTWSWAGALLQVARKKGDLDKEDMPQPDHYIRAENLVSTWLKANHGGSLVWSVCREYRYRLALQWLVILGRCALGIAPFWAMLRLVQLLEKRSSVALSELEPWALVILLGVCTLSDQWLDGWIIWYAISRLCIPVRTQLSALVFEKSLRRKNVRAAEKKTEETDGLENAKGDGKGSKDSSSTASEDSDITKSRQTVVNLVGVDSKHISDFLIIQYYIVTSFVKLIIYSTFLVRLIGWVPFGVGITAWALVLPVNGWISRVYMKAEDTLMKTRDKKLAVVNEALLGMRQIKFSALEEQWEDKINKMREVEIGDIKRVFAAETFLFFCWIASPILLAATSLAVYASVHGALSPSVAFVSVGVFKSLEVSLSAIPECLAAGLDTLVSIRRIETYLKGPEIEKTITEGAGPAFVDATLAWPVNEETPSEERFILSNVSLDFPPGELSVISGKTGTGKSLLLSALLGEADLLHGKILMPPTTPPLERCDEKAHPGNWILSGAVAYVGQTPWLESASFRDNILFGLPFLEDRYDKVMEACALKRDLEVLIDGDRTELGANGVNLSGEQKWRVTLARAVYSRAEILVLDDIFSAVDAHVGRQIFDICVMGEICRDRTRILVTHHVALVQSKAKYLVELGEGTVAHSGPTAGLAEDGTLEAIKLHEQTHVEIKADETADSGEAGSSAEATVVLDHSEDEVNAQRDDASKIRKDFVAKETHEKGMVKRHVYATYMRSSGGLFFWIACAVLYVAFEAGNLGRNWWLKKWTDGPREQQLTNSTATQHGMAYAFTLQHSAQHAAKRLVTTEAADTSSLSFYLSVYVALAAGSAVIGTFRFLWSFMMSLQASRALFRRILFTVMRTKLRWIDTVPTGRILNRMTANFEVIDNHITLDLGFLFWRLLGLLGVCAAAMLVSMYILPLAVVLVFLSGIVGLRFLAGARPVKRLESTAKSPVFDLFNATLEGVPLLRAFQKTHIYIERMYGLLNSWGMLSVYVWTLNRWLGLRMALFGTLFTTLVGAIVIGSSFVDAAMAGFTLSFALDFSSNMLMAIRSYASLELDMNAAERVIEYAELDTEDLAGDEPPAAWPTSGRVEVKDLVVGYADDLPPVLKSVSFNIANNERIGVIGQTGAGKSSLTLALFRFIEARSGTILIDGLDTSRINLHSLRSRLAIIPQDPVLFSGTVRSNLDPFDQHSDDELRDCLGRVHLVDSGPATPANEPSTAADSGMSSTVVTKNVNIFRDLSSGISESGGNLSQGQRQLLCIARAIVSRPKIMVLDEATLAVDMSTDALIQRSIREEFIDSTLVVIAHRLSTIVDFDRILVLSDGNVAEFGTPRELWDKENGVFRNMCEHSGEKDKLREAIVGGCR